MKAKLWSLHAFPLYGCYVSVLRRAWRKSRAGCHSAWPMVKQEKNSGESFVCSHRGETPRLPFSRVLFLRILGAAVISLQDDCKPFVSKALLICPIQNNFFAETEPRSRFSKPGTEMPSPPMEIPVPPIEDPLPPEGKKTSRTIIKIVRDFKNYPRRMTVISKRENV